MVRPHPEDEEDGQELQQPAQRARLSGHERSRHRREQRKGGGSVNQAERVRGLRGRVPQTHEGRRGPEQPRGMLPEEALHVETGGPFGSDPLGHRPRGEASGDLGIQARVRIAGPVPKDDERRGSHHHGAAPRDDLLPTQEHARPCTTQRKTTEAQRHGEGQPDRQNARKESGTGRKTNHSSNGSHDLATIDQASPRPRVARFTRVSGLPNAARRRSHPHPSVTWGGTGWGVDEKRGPVATPARPCP